MAGEDRPRRHWLRNRWWRAFLVLCGLAAALWLFKAPLLRAAISYLVHEDRTGSLDAMYVLGGGALDRGKEAARLAATASDVPFYTTGSNIDGTLEEWGIVLSEGEVTRGICIKHGIEPGRITALRIGTSTMEEADAILIHARMMGYDTIGVLSSRYHLRRIDEVFTDRFAEKGILVKRYGAFTDRFQETTWWQSEDGLIAIQNEYIKLFYYRWKY